MVGAVLGQNGSMEVVWRRFCVRVGVFVDSMCSWTAKSVSVSGDREFCSGRS